MLLGDAPTIFTCGQNTFVSDNYVIGRSSGQNGWQNNINEAFDEAIENIGNQACRGSGVWRLSNLHQSGGFTNQPLSPALTKSAGESNLRSVGGGDSMFFEFFFKSKAVTGDWTIVSTSFASSPTIDRMTDIIFVNAIDDNGGLYLMIRDGASLATHQIIGQLDRTKWHHLKVVLETPDGPGNDIIKVYVNGTLAGTYTSWEDWFDGNSQPSLAVSRVIFRLSQAVANVNGLYIDDFQQVLFDSSEPTKVIESYKTGFEN